MGFGTLFIGYFFLINISYFSYTDIIGAMIMLMGLYQLSRVNRSFKLGACFAIGFAVFALGELSLSIAELFAQAQWLSAVISYLSAIRYIFIFILSLFILRGIHEVAREVEADALSKSAKTAIPLTAVFLAAAALELPFLSDIFGAATAYIYFFVLLAIVVFIISNLITIYKAYMQICMPEDLKREPKKSKFEFMNRFYDSIEAKSREYAEYKLGKAKEKTKTKKRKK